MQAVADNFPIILTAMLISLALCWWGISHYFIAAKSLDQHDAEDSDTVRENNQFATVEAVNRQTLSRTRAMTQTMKGGRISAELKSFAALQNQIRQKQYQHRAPQLSPSASTTSSRATPTLRSSSSTATQKQRDTGLSDRRLSFDKSHSGDLDTSGATTHRKATGKSTTTADPVNLLEERNATANSDLNTGGTPNDDMRVSGTTDGALADQSKSIGTNQRSGKERTATSTHVDNVDPNTTDSHRQDAAPAQTASTTKPATEAASGADGSVKQQQPAEGTKRDKVTDAGNAEPGDEAVAKDAGKAHGVRAEKVHHADNDTGIKIASAKEKRATESVERRSASPAADSGLPRVAAYQTPGLNPPSLKSAVPLTEVKSDRPASAGPTADNVSGQRVTGHAATSGRGATTDQATKANPGARSDQRVSAKQDANSDQNATADQSTGTDLNKSTQQAAITGAAKDAATSASIGKSKFGSWFSKGSKRKNATAGAATSTETGSVKSSFNKLSPDNAGLNKTASDNSDSDNVSSKPETPENHTSGIASSANASDQNSPPEVSANAKPATQSTTPAAPNAGARQTAQHGAAAGELRSAAASNAGSTVTGAQEQDSRQSTSQAPTSNAPVSRDPAPQRQQLHGANADSQNNERQGAGSRSNNLHSADSQKSALPETEAHGTETSSTETSRTEAHRTESPTTDSQTADARTPESSAVSRLLRGEFGQSAKTGGSTFARSGNQSAPGDSDRANNPKSIITSPLAGKPHSVAQPPHRASHEPSHQTKLTSATEDSTADNGKQNDTGAETRTASTPGSSAFQNLNNGRSNNAADKKSDGQTNSTSEEKYKTAAKTKQTPSTQEAQLQLKPADITALSLAKTQTQDENTPVPRSSDAAASQARENNSATAAIPGTDKTASSDETTDAGNAAASEGTPRFTAAAELENTLALEARDQQIKELNARIAELESQQHKKTATAPTQSDDSSELKQKLADTAEELKLSNQKVGKLQSTVQALQSRAGHPQTAPLSPAKVVAHNRAPLSSKVRVLDISSVS